MAMRADVAAAAIAILLAAGCHHGPPPPAGPHGRPEHPGVFASGNISANSFFGDIKVTAMNAACAGRVQLAQGVATLKDTCFSGDTNVVLCTDSTAANPVRCAAGDGQLEISGTGTDIINYARVR
jgi:hypothetical protein